MARNLLFEIEPLQPSRIFEYFNYAQIFCSVEYNIYQSGSTQFFVFLSQGEQQCIYSKSDLAVISKQNLILQLSEASSLHELADIVTLIGQQSTQTNNSNITQTTDEQYFLKLALDVSAISEDPGEWYSLPMFKKRIYRSPTMNTFKIPLCEYNGKSAVRYLNVVEWDGMKTTYLNSNPMGIMTTVPGEFVDSLFVACHPIAWEKFSLNSVSLQHFFVLAHPKATYKALTDILGFQSEHKYKKIKLGFVNLDDTFGFYQRFICEVILKAYSEIVAFEIENDGYHLTMKVVVVSSFATKCWQFLNKLNYTIEDQFAGNGDEIQLAGVEAPLASITKAVAGGFTKYTAELPIEKDLPNRIELIAQAFDVNLTVEQFFANEK